MNESPAIYAVFGAPVLHSRSPQLFAPLLQPGNLYHRIRPRSASDLVHIVRSSGLRGASITAPFKERLLPLVDECTPEARTIGAVNCIRREGDVVYGHNTDHYGVTGPLREAGIAPETARILVLGAGGAARAAVCGLLWEGAEVAISNRTPERARKLAAETGCSVVPWEPSPPLPPFDAVVSTILPDGIPPFIDRLQYGLLLDAIYVPSRMTRYSRTKNIPVLGGEQWLVYQGVEAAAFYFGKRGDPHTLRQALGADCNKDNPQVLVLREDNIAQLGRTACDLVVSAAGADQETINQWIDEERRLAFGR